MCSFRKQSGLGDFLRAVKLIIWDEAPMAKRWAIETFDRTMQDIVGDKQPFGGKVVVFGGDFRQVLPVVPKGTIHQTINASLVKCDLWPIMEKFNLSENIRARSDPKFSEFLLRVGNGEEPTNEEGNIHIPKEMVVPYDTDETSEQRLIDLIFPSLDENRYSIDYMSKRAILAPKNEDVDKLNNKMIKQFQGRERIYASFDEAIDDTHNYYTEEFLNSMNPNGMPPHKLILKKNCPIMLLRNLDPADGMCNGMRLLCRDFKDNIIHA
ncbi:hypothetical protein LIER_34537 [Lithospermum erythrorhizon]|uniref:ATP-dependent DNA helicase n=1 Tax=Lithospermum erythrorhizon TaxID=34254 RepID=A0AAV3S351_LITER